MASCQSTNTSLVSVTDLYLAEYLYRWFTLHVTDEKLLKKLSATRVYCETLEIETFRCRVFLVACEDDNRIRVWLNERETQVEKCSDYMFDKYDSNRMQPCWVCKSVQINPLWLIDLAEEIDENAIDKPDFYRLHGDRKVGYGDGGQDFLVYPVWIHDNLPVKDLYRQRLLNVLNELNDERRDCHPAPSPVEDIIDPDLLPFRPPSVFDRDRWIARRQKQLTNAERQQRTFKRDLGYGDYDNLSEHEKIRDTYQWLPSDFVIQTDGRVDIQTPIHHLPVLPQYRQAYGAIAQIFHAMLPMFEQLKLIRKDSDREQRLQVIVKAQSYNLKAGMKYSGRWHTEGQTENIVAAGVYYLHIDEELTGGALKFRPKRAPQDHYRIETAHTVSSLKTGAAVAFSNSIPHRFQQIQNLTRDDGRRRTFLNFFIVDPDQPIPMQSSTILRSPKNAIVEVFQEWNEGRLPGLIVDKIFELLNPLATWDSQEEAKEFRARVRRAMLDEKTGWGWICWGNCGTTEFVRALCAWPPREREETREALQHTESD